MSVKFKIEYQLCDKFGRAAIENFDIYENAGHFYVYPKSLGLEPMYESPFHYSVLVVDSEGEVLKDNQKIFDGYATVHF